MIIRGDYVRASFLAVILVGMLCNSAFGQTYDVYFDPGHGGSDPGAPSYPVIEGCSEKDVNLRVGLEIDRLLTEAWGVVAP